MSVKEQYGPINLGNPDERTIRELAELICKQTGNTNSIAYKELPADDPLKRKPDITKAESLLGWQPQVSLEEGIQKTISYFKKVV